MLTVGCRIGDIDFHFDSPRDDCVGGSGASD
jgi:hypothetical protein